MSVVTVNREQVRQRIADVVDDLMVQEELYRQDLLAEEMVETIFQTVAENHLLETFAAISDEDLRDRCNSIMAMHLWATAGKDMSPQELDELIDAIEGR
ncbi:hypothetical protein PN466_25185 [Roseofilum reptotaenium CS-1145]|uniref:Uncharacterized protein n=1 Tax=Roseofilum reptotaenium AO1-A TaxID=1925591 RepID=A0A1L9QVM5_9CYAN|nr:hypothetical protein [Roseofilum reptotaenium]MDB9520244.1 hypothetical protein [Roseofilum reptotaenium CS-1145]OJJ26714.1 hypothetical protein BI308_04895 [Roseofilum reptotaenium AO1-A]